MTNGGVDILLNLIDKATPELKKFSSEFKKGMDDAANASEKTSKKTETETQKMGAAFAKFGTAILAVTAAVGTFATVLTVALTRVNQLNQLDMMAQKFGYTTTQMAALNLVLGQMDATLTDIEGVYTDVSNALQESVDPASEAAKAFDALGIATRDAEGNLRDYKEVALEASIAIKKAIDDQTLSTTKLYQFQRLLGQQAKEDSAAVRAEAEGRELANKRHQDGIAISKNATDVAKENRRANNDLVGVLDKMASILVEVLVPTFTELTKALYSSYVNGGLLRQAFDILVAGGQLLTVVIKMLGIMFVGLDTTIALVIRSIYSLGNALQIALTAPITQRGDLLKKEWEDYWNGIIKITEDSRARIAALSVPFDQPVNNPEAPNDTPPQATIGSATTPRVRSAPEWETFRKQLETQAAMLGKNNYELNLYRINVLAATIANKQARQSFVEKATALAQQIDAFERNKEEQDRAQQIEQQYAESIRNTMVSLQDQLEQLEFEYAMLGKTNDEREEAIILRNLEKLGIDATTEGIQDMLRRMRELNVELRRQSELNDIVRNTESAKLEEQRRRIALVTEELVAGRISEEQYFEMVDVVLDRTSEAAETVSEFWVNAAKNMQNAMSTFFFDVMQGKMSDLVGSFKTMIDRMVAEYMASQLASILFGDMTRSGTRATNTGLLGVVGSALSGMFRAAGGPVAGGSPYIVGEIGPELFVPKTSGTIIPANQTASMMSGGNSIQLSVTAMDSQDVIRAMDKIKRPLAEMLNGTNRTYNLGVR